MRKKHGIYCFGNRHVDTMPPGQCQRCLRRVHALGNVSECRQNGLQVFSLREKDPDASVARKVAGRSQDKVAQAGETHKGFRLAAHRNAQAGIYPFLLLGLVFVLAGGTRWTAAILFGTFTVARLLHSIAYLKEKQPWRTLFFVVGVLATIALILDIVWLLIRAF